MPDWSPITVSADIDRPAHDVFAYATDPSRFAEWQKGVVSGHLEADGSPSVGDRCVTVRRIGFANRPSTSELVRIDPPRSWRVHGIDEPLRAIVQVTEGHGIGALLVPMIVRRQARSEMPTNIAKLKARLEGPS
jgi:hypothetical protein